jgi:DNA-binding GntR family transcriptional regulator
MIDYAVAAMDADEPDLPTRNDDAFAGPRSRNNTAAIHDVLRDDILKGDLQAGTVLNQVRIAENFGVSRGPVREALRLLQREGLVEAELNHRVRVADFSVRDLEQLYAMRILNETLAVAATVPNLTQDELEHIAQALVGMDAAADRDIDRWDALHRSFHLGLSARAGPRLLSLIAQLFDHADRYRRAYIDSDPRAFSVGSTEHRQIYDAAKRGDAEGAADAVAEHLARTALTVLANSAPSHDPVLVRRALSTAVARETKPSTRRR